VMHRRILTLAAILSFGMMAEAASVEDVAVEIRNASVPVRCAEKDNVTVNFLSPETRSFRIEAVNPSYSSALREDRFQPNWTACGELTKAGSSVPPVRKATLFETVDLWVVGYSFSNFWRKSDVRVRIADRTEEGIHLLQVWVRRNERAEEVMVLYPADGYWRIRTLPPPHLGWTAYGSSFLVGPVEVRERPLVDIREVVFDPARMTFSLAFAGGGNATLAVKDLTIDRIALDVTFDAPISGKPFAALRSMYVTEWNADVAHIAVREEGEEGWREERIMAFDHAKATDAWFGRLVPSRHNMSAPDMMFTHFRAQ
jgi:hypothetical protein